MAKRIRSSRIPSVPKVAKPKPWPVVARPVEEWPVVAEAKGGGKRRKRKPRALLQKLAKAGLVKAPPTKKAKARKTVTPATVKRRAKRRGPSARQRAVVPEFIQRLPVASSNVASIGWDGPSQILEVEFHSGAVYRYWGVNESVWTSFQRARSKGKFVWRNLRGYGSDTLYVYERME